MKKKKCLLFFSDPYDDDLKVKTQRPRSADQPGVFQAQTGEYYECAMVPRAWNERRQPDLYRLYVPLKILSFL